MCEMWRSNLEAIRVFSFPEPATVAMIAKTEEAERKQQLKGNIPHLPVFTWVIENVHDTTILS